MKNKWVFEFGGKEVPRYDEKKGYGFVDTSCAIMPRTVDVSKVTSKPDAFVVTETDDSRFQAYQKGKSEIDYEKLEAARRYNLGGMIFRVKVPAGTYRIVLETTMGEAYTLVSVSGLRGIQLVKEGHWDAAGRVPMRHPAKWKENTWSYEFVNTREYVDIEVEPLAPHIEIGIKKLMITAISLNRSGEEEKQTLFILGDSTVKSYIFKEAPMCGWGQLLGRLFDLDQINIVNYAAGGRSLKMMYFEGRLNDVLLTGKKGDYILLQSGHNDESDDLEQGETARFGRGATEEMYRRYLEEIYLPAIEMSGMIPIFVTPMTRVNKALAEDGTFHNSFTNRKFPEIMKKVAEKGQIPVIDLNAKSVEYINEIGQEGAEAIVLSIEAGETPGKTNSGSFANGNPSGDIDRTHMKEALAKNYARIVATELYDLTQRFETLKKLEYTFKENVKYAIHTGDWECVYPEICKDTLKGKGAYYRNQIEKMVELEVLQKDSYGNFNPKEKMTVEMFKKALFKLYDLPSDGLKAYEKEEYLTREVMGAMILEVYEFKFNNREKPKYMTEYNGTNITPDDPEYDPNLIGEEAQYYPMIGYECLKDLDHINPKYREKLRKAYNLGLIRSERDIERGKMKNGRWIQPKEIVTKEKGAKALYFMWVLDQDIDIENHGKRS